MSHVSLKDIAARAGVSFQTVSKVLRGKGSVAPETRALIMEAAEQLGYVPNVLARSLVNQQTATIGIVAADFSDFVLAQFVVGAEREARRLGQCAIIGSLDRDGSDCERYIRLLMERRVDGMLLAAPQLEQNECVGELLYGQLPVVSIHHVSGLPIRSTEPPTMNRGATGRDSGVVERNFKTVHFSTVGSDHSQTGFLATQHLLELGHQRIGTITGPQERLVTQSRLRGYQRALKAADIEYDEELVEEADWQVEGGYHATHRLLERVPDLTALYVHNDTMAIGVLSALHQRGLRVPQNCAVVGCDDIPMAAHTIPPLTTVHIPFYETGEAAVRLLLDLIAQQVEEPRRILLPVSLVRRQSSGSHEDHPS